MSETRRPRPGPPPPDDTGVDPDRPLPAWATGVGIAGLVVVAAVGAVIGVLLTPYRIGTVLVPVAVVLAVVVNVVLARLGYALTRSRSVAALPVLVFFVVGWALTISPGGDVLVPGGSGAQTAISYGTLLLGALAGAVTAARVR